MKEWYVQKLHIPLNMLLQKEKNQTIAVKYYNLDAIISDGYSVNSQKVTKFRIWTTDNLKDFIQKGFKIDVERMKQGENVFGKVYFRELIVTKSFHWDCFWIIFNLTIIHEAESNHHKAPSRALMQVFK